MILRQVWFNHMARGQNEVVTIEISAAMFKIYSAQQSKLLVLLGNFFISATSLSTF